MQLRSPYPFWLMRNGYVHSYPYCDGEKKADVLVVGAGITGALTAYLLAREGLHVIVVDKRHPGMGSTAASTALLQYEIDEPLHSLIELCGRERAEGSYRACYEAVNALAVIVHEEKVDADFDARSSLQYASFKKDVPGLKKEYAARRKLGFDIEMLGGDDIREQFGFSAPAALLSARAAQVDAYRLVHGLLALPYDNLETYDCCEVLQIEDTRRGVRVHTTSGVVQAGHAVLACGYETEKFLPFSCATIGATFALVTKPLPDKEVRADLPLLWETKEPYLYVRVTSDNRIMAGGRDDESHNAARRDRDLPRKVKGLLGDLSVLFPDQGLVADYTWAGAFASTKDSLGYADKVPGKPRVYCNLGFGGNGILYSLIGGEIIRDSILGRDNGHKDLFPFNR